MSCSPETHPEIPDIQDGVSAFLRLSAKTPDFGTLYRINSFMFSKNTITGEIIKRKLPCLMGAVSPPVLRQTPFETVPAGNHISMNVTGRIDDRRSLIFYYLNHELAFDTRAGHIYDVVIEIVDHHPGRKFNMIVYEKETNSDDEKGEEIVINRGFPLNATEWVLNPILVPATDICIDE